MVQAKAQLLIFWLVILNQLQARYDIQGVGVVDYDLYKNCDLLVICETKVHSKSFITHMQTYMHTILLLL